MKRTYFEGELLTAKEVSTLIGLLTDDIRIHRLLSSLVKECDEVIWVADKLLEGIERRMALKFTGKGFERNYTIKDNIKEFKRNG